MKQPITWSDFNKIDLRIGTIIRVDHFIEAIQPAYKLWIDFGNEIGVLKSSAQITTLYSKAELLERQIVAVLNFPPKQVANMMSECLVLGGIGNAKDVVLIEPDRKMENGTRIG